MKLILKQSIPLVDNYPETPEWLFCMNNALSPQTISLDEEHMKELLMFIQRYSVVFNEHQLEVSLVTFSDIILEYNPNGE